MRGMANKRTGSEHPGRPASPRDMHLSGMAKPSWRGPGSMAIGRCSSRVAESLQDHLPTAGSKSEAEDSCRSKPQVTKIQQVASHPLKSPLPMSMTSSFTIPTTSSQLCIPHDIKTITMVRSVGPASLCCSTRPTHSHWQISQWLSVTPGPDRRL